MTFETTVKDMVLMMCEGNPGALSVIMEILKDEAGVLWLCHLDDMNIRGSQVWIGFKYYCGQDMKRFVECIKTRDEGMIAKINAGRPVEGS